MIEERVADTPGWRLVAEAALLTVGIGTILMIGWADGEWGLAALFVFCYVIWWIGKRKTPVTIGNLVWLVVWDLVAVGVLMSLR